MLRRDPAAKVLIFSQFTSMLDILHYRLTQVPNDSVGLLGHVSLSAWWTYSPLACFAQGVLHVWLLLSMASRQQCHPSYRPSGMPTLMCSPCAQAGIQCVVLKGSMTMEQRDRMIDAFTNDASVTVFLMSLKAGGACSPCCAGSVAPEASHMKCCCLQAGCTRLLSSYRMHCDVWCRPQASR
jgi:hypothetical protein